MNVDSVDAAEEANDEQYLAADDEQVEESMGFDPSEI